MEHEFPMHNLEIARYSLQRIRFEMTLAEKNSERMRILRAASKVILQRWSSLT